MKSLLPVLILAALALTSCSSVKTAMQKVGKPMASLAKTNTERLKNFRFPGFNRRNSKTPPIVKVRREDLREVQLGSEKVLAWNRSKADGGGVVYFPIDFDPSKLPIGGQLPSTGILPPMNPSPAVSGELPDDIANLPDLSDSDFEEKEGE